MTDEQPRVPLFILLSWEFRPWMEHCCLEEFWHVLCIKWYKMHEFHMNKKKSSISSLVFADQTHGQRPWQNVPPRLWPNSPHRLDSVPRGRRPKASSRRHCRQSREDLSPGKKKTVLETHHLFMGGLKWFKICDRVSVCYFFWSFLILVACVCNNWITDLI